MGYKLLSLSLPVNYSEDDIEKAIKKELKINNFTYKIDLKSLDARNKNNIKWQIRVLIESEELATTNFQKSEKLEIKYQKRNSTIAVIGNGPAGYFAADVLANSGFKVSIFERGAIVRERVKSINLFEKEQKFFENANYVYGEGGAGTFSDGKLTSRTKNISKFKQYIIEKYINAGAPKEIEYLSKPHIGSNFLRKVVHNLNEHLKNQGVEFYFNTKVTDILRNNNKWTLYTDKGIADFDLIIFAPGHSAYDTYRMLIKRGVTFQPKPFAIGVRVEHYQEMINQAQWGKTKIEGLKAAEYFLTWNDNSTNSSCYTFCMCPGGKIVQASPKEGLNIVNGMSNYERNSLFANSAVVVAINPIKILREKTDALQTIEWLENLEIKVWEITNSFAVPANLISSFLNDKVSANIPENSYSHGTYPYDFRLIFPEEIIKSLKKGLQNFSKQIKGFETGLMMGLESKTSAPIQVLRNSETYECLNNKNLFVIGEGSGFSGGIISSAVEGIKCGLTISEIFK